MDQFFPGEKRFVSKNADGKIVENWTCGVLNWKAYVVCEPCNNGWMSDIEKWHAKPAMSDFIVGKLDIPIPQSRANSIALFAFKTAVILDYMAAGRQPFWGRTVRHSFKERPHVIPDNLMMFMARYAIGSRGDAHTGYFDGAVSNTQYLKMYVCAFAVGHFVFEVVGYNTRGITKLTPRNTAFDSLAVPLWPSVRSGTIWPCASVLKTVADFDSFSVRWRDVDVRLL